MCVCLAVRACVYLYSMHASTQPLFSARTRYTILLARVPPGLRPVRSLVKVRMCSPSGVEILTSDAVYVRALAVWNLVHVLVNRHHFLHGRLWFRVRQHHGVLAVSYVNSSSLLSASVDVGDVLIAIDGDSLEGVELRQAGKVCPPPPSIRA